MLRALKIFILYWIAICCWSSAAQTNATFFVTDIQLEGLQRVSPESIYATISIKNGDRIDQYTIADTVREIFEMGLFRDIEVSVLDNSILIFKLYELPTISEIELEGNKALKSDDLTQSLSENGITEGNIYNPMVMSGIENAIEREYVSQGHYSSKVQTEIEELPRNRVKVKLVIDEGKKATIRRIHIIGNKQFSESELLKLFELRKAGLFPGFSQRNKYSKAKLEGDLENLESFYLNKGYLEFEVTSIQVSISQDMRSIFITIQIDEGEVFHFGKVELVGDIKIPESTLRRLIAIKEGLQFSQSRLDTIETWVNQLHARYGYTLSEVEIRKTPRSDTNADGSIHNVVDIDFIINPGSRTYVRRIEFVGNTKTRDEVMRREMRQLEGAPASNQKIDYGKIRLERLVNFETVEVEKVPVPGVNDQIDVIYTVKEQFSGSIGGSIGYSDLYGLVLQANLSEQNFLGTGNAVSLNLSANNYSQIASIGYSNPFFTLNGINSGVNLSFRRYDYSKINISTYSTNSVGLNFNLGYPIGETQRINYGLGVEQLHIVVGAFAPEEVRYLTDNTDRFNSANATVSWYQNALNRGLLPDRGYSQSLGFSSTLPFSDLNYYRLNYSGQIFVPVYQDWVMRFKSNLGFGDAYGNKTDKLPFFHNFYAGGFGSVRGFEGNTLGPRETPQTSEATTAISDQFGNTVTDDNGQILTFPSYTYNSLYSVRPIGGNVLVTGTAELILGFPFLSNNRSLQASLFFDYGNIFDTECGDYPQQELSNGAIVPRRLQEYCTSPNINDLRYSYGLGFSWISGLGPMSFSFGETINRNDKTFNGEYYIEPEESKFFQFSVGRVF